MSENQGNRKPWTRWVSTTGSATPDTFSSNQSCCQDEIFRVSCLSWRRSYFFGKSTPEMSSFPLPFSSHSLPFHKPPVMFLNLRPYLERNLCFHRRFQNRQTPRPPNSILVWWRFCSAVTLHLLLLVPCTFFVSIAGSVAAECSSFASLKISVLWVL